MGFLKVGRINPGPDNFKPGQSSNLSNSNNNNSGHMSMEITQVEVPLTRERVEEGEVDMTTGSPRTGSLSPNHIRSLRICNRSTTPMICNNNININISSSSNSTTHLLISSNNGSSSEEACLLQIIHIRMMSISIYAAMRTTWT